MPSRCPILRSLRQRADRTRRYLQVTRIAARHGLSCYLGGRRPGTGEPRPLARNLRVALEEAGYVGLFFSLVLILRVIITITRDGI